MTSPTKRRQRRADVAARAACPDHMSAYCRVLGCNRPARAGTTGGLDRRYCRAHADHYQRHGSPTKGSYPARVLNPYRRAALAWLMANPENPYVQIAIRKVEGLYQRAGPHIEAFRLQGMEPRERAWAAWARLRTHQIDPRLPVAAWLAIEMVVRTDLEPASGNEFKRVQAAKLVHRMASGSHKRWEHTLPDPGWAGQRKKTVVKEMHKYPKSRGRVLRHLGKDLEVAVELLVEYHLRAIHGYTISAIDASAAGTSPFVNGLTVMRRKRTDTES